MPASNSVKHALELIKNDESKILGVEVDGKEIRPGDFIAKASMLSKSLACFWLKRFSPREEY